MVSTYQAKQKWKIVIIKKITHGQLTKVVMVWILATKLKLTLAFKAQIEGLKCYPKFSQPYQNFWPHKWGKAVKF